MTYEEALDILHKFDLFYGQRSGRELWGEKPSDIQNEDIDNFKRDVAFLEDFINRQEAEIEKLTLLANAFASAVAQSVEREDGIRAEAVKEFAERLKAEKFTHRNFGELVYVEDIDNLVKELPKGDNTDGG